MQHPTSTSNERLGTVMVLDDDADIRDSVVDALTDEGYETVAFDVGQDALAWLDANPSEPKVMLLDLMMPAMSGDEFLAAKENHPSAAAVPVILMTGSGRDASDSLARRHAIVRCLSKPLLLEALVIAVRACVGTPAPFPVL